MSTRSSSRGSVRSSSRVRDRAVDRTSYRSSVQNLIETFYSDSSRDSSPTPLGSGNMTDSEVNMAAASAVLNSLVDIKVTSGDVGNLVRSLESMRGSLLDWVSGNIAFAGFDAQEMRDSLIKKLHGKSIVLGVLIGLVRGNRQRYLPCYLGRKLDTVT
ncbi:unnamed protein product [Arctia plantaginis]|uniref:Uncharacterized protein n=1 Tax=Arctia plantaginis TaxID=874455 RepID=A0A8S1A6G6_ARCPL|nr:unnamed protein product [Arctia plantaginis]